MESPIKREQPPVVVVAVDKFRGTASARDVSDAIADVARDAGATVDVQPMSDGGEGFASAFKGDVQFVEVAGLFGQPATARVTIVDTATGSVGVIEVADVVGRDLLTSPTSAQSLGATSEGVGHLILASARLGVDSILVGCGGTATSDGGVGCYRVLADAGGLPVPVTAATDVTTVFSGAVRYARQKGVALADLPLVDRRLRDARSLYLAERDVDVESLARTGAAGGVAGAIAALGGALVGGFDAVATMVDLETRIKKASLVITGEGRFDAGTMEGKVVLGVVGLVPDGVRVLVVCGSAESSSVGAFNRRFPDARVEAMEDHFGSTRAMNDVFECVKAVVRDEFVRWRTS